MLNWFGSWFGSKNHALLGIDISSTSIKILEISISGNQHCINGYGRAILPENAIEGNVIKDIDAVASSIKKLLISANLSCKEVVCAVPESSTIAKIIQLNNGLSNQDIEE